MDDEIKIMAEQLMKSRPDDESLLEDLRLQDIEDRIMGRSRPYKRGERMLRLLDPTMDPLTGERDVKGFARQMVTNVAPPGALQRHNPLMNLIREANRLSKAYHGQDYVKELKERIDQAGTPVNLKDFEPKFQEGGSSKNDLTFFGGSMKPPGTPEHEKLQADTLGIIKQMDDASVMATASRMTGLPFSTPTQARLVLEQMLGGGSISAGVSGTGRVLPERVSGYDIGAKFPALGGQMSVGATIPRGEGSPIVNVGYRRQFQEGGLVEDTDKIVDQLVAGGMDPEQAMILALRMAQSRQQSLLGGVEPPTSDVPPVQEPILGGDTSRLFQRDPTLLERAKQLPADVLGAGEALASFGSAAALMPASMLYALRPGQKTQGNPLEFMQRNMYIPRTESGARHLQGLGELLENLPQTGPLPELQAFTGIGKGVGRQLQQKGREAAQSLAPAAANVAEDFLSRQGLLLQAAPSSPKPAAPRSDIGFYSPAEEAAMSLQRQSGRGEGFLNDLKKAGVRDEELEFSGLKEFLAGKPNVTKQDIDDYIKNNKVQVDEVVLGLPSDKQVEYNRRRDEITQLRDRGGQISDREAERRLTNLREELGFDEYGNPLTKAKYASYQLPGGENYREVLLTLPIDEEKYARSLVDPAVWSRMTEEQRAEFMNAPIRGGAAGTFKSAHWDQPNVISHIRLNDRTDADGKKVLFVEEIQSDWGQEGKKKGFRDDTKQEQEFEKLAAEHVKTVERRSEIVGKPEFYKEYEELQRKELKLINEMNKLHDIKQYGVSFAPFVQNTKDWVNLSLKRIMNMAAEQGYDRVAFINGSQSADRYDLSKQVDRIVVPMVNANNTRSVRIDPVNGASIELMVNPNGTVLGFGAGSNQFTGKRLDEVVGKELADKIMKSPAETELTGIDLKVGGEGMKSFYDKIVPDLAGKLVSKYGGKMQPVKVSDETQLGFDITPQMKEATARGLPMFKKGGHVKAVESARRAIMKAMGGSVKMAGGGLLGKAAKGAAKAGKAGSESAQRIAKTLQEAAVDKKQVVATPAEIDRALAASAKRIGNDNPKLSEEAVAKKAEQDVEARLKWERIEKPSATKEFGVLVDQPYTAPKARRLQNVPSEVDARVAAAQEFLRQPTEPWQPPKPGLQAFDRSLIKESLEGFPGVEQTRFPRYQPARADIGYVGEMYDNPRNRELIKQQIMRGLPLGGETFYGSLYPLKVAALERGIPAEKFEQFIYQTAPASARNSIMNEMAVGQFLRDMNARGLPLDEKTVKQEMTNFKQKYGIGLPLMPTHRQGVQQVIERGTNLREQVKANIPTNYKIPTYGTQKAGDFGKSVVLDVHEAAGETLGSPYHPYFTRQGGFGPTEYGLAESKMLDIANELGIPGGMAQAGRWFGGGELTGLKSPRGDALDLLEKQTAYTLQGQGIKPTPRAVRNYILDMIETGEGVLMPYFKSEGMPDVRTMKKRGGSVSGLSVLRKKHGN